MLLGHAGEQGPLWHTGVQSGAMMQQSSAAAGAASPPSSAAAEAR